MTESEKRIVVRRVRKVSELSFLWYSIFESNTVREDSKAKKVRYSKQSWAPVQNTKFEQERTSKGKQVANKKIVVLVTRWNEVYESRWFAFKALDFLKDRNTPNKGMTTEKSNLEDGYYSNGEQSTLELITPSVEPQSKKSNLDPKLQMLKEASAAGRPLPTQIPDENPELRFDISLSGDFGIYNAALAKRVGEEFRIGEECRLISLALIGLALGQKAHYGDPRNAAIITEDRYLSGDGSFGAQYTQEDGVQFKEESLPDGSRRGSYSYIDPSGNKKTVSYTAGVHGFHATGDHIPQAPPTVLPVAPKPQYEPLPQYNPPPQNNYNNHQQQQPQYNQQPQPQYQQPQQYSPQPQQPQYNPQPQQYNPQYNVQPQQFQQPTHQPQNYYDNTTPQPHRFYPPGKLSLNRSPDGFSFSFNKA
ncbi:hypothetical protein FQA39_LY01553 [Lamprigera yunnana]|nr:hypothetical protein FQA39_LY01553 [Lamprigera yunnana]